MNWYFFWLLEFVTWLLGVIFNALWLKRLLWCLWYKHTLCFRWKHTANIVAVCQAATWLKKASCDETVRGDFMLTLNTANKCYHLQAHDRISAWETGIYLLCALFLMAHFFKGNSKTEKGLAAFEVSQNKAAEFVMEPSYATTAEVVIKFAS